MGQMKRSKLGVSLFPEAFQVTCLKVGVCRSGRGLAEGLLSKGFVWPSHNNTLVEEEASELCPCLRSKPQDSGNLGNEMRVAVRGERRGRYEGLVKGKRVLENHRTAILTILHGPGRSHRVQFSSRIHPRASSTSTSRT